MNHPTKLKPVERPVDSGVQHDMANRIVQQMVERGEL